MRLRDLQRFLEGIYKIDRQPNVEEFLMTGDEVRAVSTLRGRLRPQVIFQQDGDEVQMGIYLGTDRRALESRPKLGDFCTIAEEISHFVYLLWSLRNNRRVSILDVEMQGEIDKFILSRAVYGEDPTLFSRLFDSVQIETEMGRSHHDRYHLANHLGAKFCKTLLRFLYRGSEEIQSLARLREFYRRASSQRISLVQAL